MTGLSGYWAKSPAPGAIRGESLIAHLYATLEALHILQRRVGAIEALPEQFWRWAALAALFHDAGKVATGFQRMVGNTSDAARVWGQRHEVLSLGFVQSLLVAEDRLWVGIGVLTHHRPLTNDGRAILTQYQEKRAQELAARFGDVDQPAIQELSAWLVQTARAHGLHTSAPVSSQASQDLMAEAFALLTELDRRWRRLLPRARAADGLTAVLLQGAVTLADHVSSSADGGELLVRPPLDAVGYGRRLSIRLADGGHVMAPHQQQAAAVDGHLLLRAPTGSGKTEAALLWAARQTDTIAERTGGTPRVFYTLPYLASINAMTLRLGKELDAPDEIGVAHSRAASYHLARSICPEDDDTTRADGAHKAVARANATRLFRELVRVGTPYQLLRGALAGPAHAGVLLDATNSVFILDELHAYDPHRLGMILAMAGFWTRLGGRVGVVSATLPTSLACLIRDVLDTKPVEVSPQDTAWPIRHRLRLPDTHLTDPRSLAEMTDRLREGRSLLVVANNVADARDIFAKLGPVASELYGADAAMLLHSRFRRMDRNRIEERIRARFRTGAEPHQSGLLVATQVVEVSLDVDFDVLHTSTAPMEALLQRFGRVNRVGARPPADVIVHPPAYGPRRGGGRMEYADGVYDAAPTRLAWDILATQDGAVIDERSAQQWLDRIYNGDWGRAWAETVRNRQREFSELFLDFRTPFDDRSKLATKFDEMFDGVEAILDGDRDDYQAELDAAPGKAGRLLAADYLLPLPSYGGRLARYDKKLKVAIISATYTEDGGLAEIHGHEGHRYVQGEVL